MTTKSELETLNANLVKELNQLRHENELLKYSQGEAGSHTQPASAPVTRQSHCPITSEKLIQLLHTLSDETRVPATQIPDEVLARLATIEKSRHDDTLLLKRFLTNLEAEQREQILQITHEAQAHLKVLVTPLIAQATRLIGVTECSLNSAETSAEEWRKQTFQVIDLWREMSLWHGRTGLGVSFFSLTLKHMILWVILLTIVWLGAVWTTKWKIGQTLDSFAEQIDDSLERQSRWQIYLSDLTPQQRTTLERELAAKRARIAVEEKK